MRSRAKKSPVSQTGPTMSAVWRGRVVGDHGEDLVVGLVERWADEVVHGGVGDDEVLGAVLLGVEDAGEQRAGLGDEEAAGLEEEVGVEALAAPADGCGVGGDRGCGVEGCAAVLDAEASSAVDVADVEAVGAELVDQLVTRRSDWSKGSTARIWEPMWTLTPAARARGSAARR